jgi:hypothetical protein
VADLIDHTTNTWRVNVIDSILEEEAKKKKDPLFGVSEEDELIVSRSKNGEYMVRSAYYRLCKTLQKF